MPVPSSASTTRVAQWARGRNFADDGAAAGFEHAVVGRGVALEVLGAASRTTSSARGWKRVKSWRATARPSPPLLPLPHRTTMRCAASGANRSASNFHHAMAGILHQDEAGDAELDGAPVHFAHFGRGQNFHMRRATTMVISSCNSDEPVHWSTASMVRAMISEESAWAYLSSSSLQPLFAEHLAVGVFRLDDAVGVGHQHVAVLQHYGLFFVAREGECAHHGAGGIEHGDVAVAQQHGRQMAGVGVGQGVGGLVVHGEIEGGVFFRRGGGVELPVQDRDQRGRGKAAPWPLPLPWRAQLRAHGGLDGGHEQRGGNSLARHVADGEGQRAFARAP